jgi:hypothetical protein
MAMNTALVRALVFFEANAAWLLRWKVVGIVAAVYFLTFPAQIAPLTWINAASFISLALLLLLWILDRWQRKLRMGPLL